MDTLIGKKIANAVVVWILLHVSLLQLILSSINLEIVDQALIIIIVRLGLLSEIHLIGGNIFFINALHRKILLLFLKSLLLIVKVLNMNLLLKKLSFDSIHYFKVSV